MFIALLIIGYRYYYFNKVHESQNKIGKYLSSYKINSNDSAFEFIFNEVSKYKKCNLECQAGINQLILYNAILLGDLLLLNIKLKYGLISNYTYRNKFLIDIFKGSNKCSVKCKSNLNDIDIKLKQFSVNELPPQLIYIGLRYNVITDK